MLFFELIFKVYGVFPLTKEETNKTDLNNETIYCKLLQYIIKTLGKNQARLGRFLFHFYFFKIKTSLWLF